jgi:hypothetical protein
MFHLLNTGVKLPLKRGEDPVELPGPLVLDRVPEVCWGSDDIRTEFSMPTIFVKRMTSLVFAAFERNESASSVDSCSGVKRICGM